MASPCRTAPLQAGKTKPARRILAPVLQASAIVVLGAAADLATKAWAQSRLAGGREVTLGGGLLRFQLVINHGAAFGLGARFQPALAIVSVLHGGVVDWLHVSFYGPTFNLADVMLRGGVILAAAAWLLQQRSGARPAAPPASPAGEPAPRPAQAAD